MTSNYIKFAGPLIDEATLREVDEVFRSGHIASGPKVLAFEKALSEYVGGRPVRVMTSATAATEIALQLCGIGPGAEVILSAQSFFSTSNMVEKAGAKPVFVDCDLHTRGIDLGAADGAVTERTRAIMPTHFNAPLDLEALYAFAARHRIRVIEDAALALGSSWQGAKLGSRGDLCYFSFHPNKNITSIEGGALVVNDEAEAKRVECLRFHGIAHLPDRTRDVECAAGKSNMPDVSAAVGLAQMRHLDAFVARRRELAQRYFAKLATDPPVVLPPDPEGHSWNMFPVLLPLDRLAISRKEFIEAMHARAIGIGISYEALHLSTVSRRHGYREGMFPNAERIARETVSLPLHPGLSDADVDRVCAEVADVFASSRK
jgi:dTDP-4-amino-4,6-dideoxygalactose transaminase